MAFVRGRDIKKSLDVGMISIWPDVAEILDSKVQGILWKVEGGINEDDDFFLVFKRRFTNGDNNTRKFEIIINCDTKLIWAQSEFIDNTEHYSGKLNKKVTEKGKDWNTTKTYKLEAEGSGPKEISKSIQNQVYKIWTDFNL